MHICIKNNDMHVHVCVCVCVCAFMEKSRVSTAAKSCHAIDSAETLLFIVVAAAAAAQLKHNYK